MGAGLKAMEASISKDIERCAGGKIWGGKVHFSIVLAQASLQARPTWEFNSS
jgi:hypothetical protein